MNYIKYSMLFSLFFFLFQIQSVVAQDESHAFNVMQSNKRVMNESTNEWSEWEKWAKEDVTIIIHMDKIEILNKDQNELVTEILNIERREGDAGMTGIIATGGEKIADVYITLPNGPLVADDDGPIQTLNIAYRYIEESGEEMKTQELSLMIKKI